MYPQSIFLVQRTSRDAFRHRMTLAPFDGEIKTRTTSS